MKAKLLLIGILALITSCQNDDGDSIITKERKDIPLSRSEEVLAEETMDFAFRLFRQVNDSETKKANWIISPFSASMALGMLTNGAAGNTLEDMKSTLGFSDFNLEGMNAYYQKLIAELLNLDNSTRLNIANSIWVNKGFQLYDTFVDVNQKTYHAKVSNLDFTSPDATTTINGWCADNTNQAIKEVTGSIPLEGNVILINALYFKGIWKTKFKKSDTKEEVFTNADGRTSKVPLMNLKEKFTYTYNDDFCIAEFLYGNAAFSMVVLLPAEGKTLEESLDKLTYDNWKKWYEQRYLQSLLVKLPRFEMDYREYLTDDLRAMGMDEAFNMEKADFSNMSPDALYFSLMEQLTYIKVDEEGTEAAAVSKVSGITAPTPNVPEPFYVNRPFAFMIKEQSTGTILFMGKVTEL